MHADSAPTLRRALSLPLLVLYGLGTTIGAGIYALMGKVVGAAGMYAPMAYMAAVVVAALSALSFAELSSRLPRAAGEVAFVQAGFGRRWLSTTIGLGVTVAACLSAAAVADGFVGYARQLVALPHWLGVLGVVVGLGAVAAWGIRQSAVAAAAMTLLEVGGLVWVIAMGSDVIADLPSRWPELLPPPTWSAWRGVVAASVLCFYAFIGFEDMVNVAEEVTDARRTMPWAIVLTLVITALLYFALSTVAVLTVDAAVLGRSEAALADLVRALTGGSATAIVGIGVLAMLNGALIQLIKGSRLLYGIASDGVGPAALARISPRTRTPVVATAVIAGAVLVLAVGFPLETLAEATAAVTLGVFCLVNVALWRLKGGDAWEAGGLPRAVPLAGAVASGAALAFEVAYRAGGIAA